MLPKISFLFLYTIHKPNSAAASSQYFSGSMDQIPVPPSFSHFSNAAVRHSREVSDVVQKLHCLLRVCTVTHIISQEQELVHPSFNRFLITGTKPMIITVNIG
jgi:hypothetical protein